MSTRKLTNRSDRARRGYQSGYGWRPTNNWGSGELLAPWSEGDVVEIPADSVAFVKREGDGHARIPHTWSDRPEECKPGLYRVVQIFSIGEGDEWYCRVCPIIDGETMWDNSSDRLHMVPDEVDWTEGWRLVESADPDNVRDDWPVKLPADIRHLPTIHDDGAVFCSRCGERLSGGVCKYEGYPVERAS